MMAGILAISLGTVISNVILLFTDIVFPRFCLLVILMKFLSHQTDPQNNSGVIAWKRVLVWAVGMCFYKRVPVFQSEAGNQFLPFCYPIGYSFCPLVLN